MAFPFTVDKSSWRGFRVEFAAAISDFKRTGAVLFDAFADKKARSAEVAPAARPASPYMASGVECDIVVAEAANNAHAVYSVYKIARAREEGLRAVATELGIGEDFEAMIASTRGELGARPVLTSYGTGSL